MVNGIKVLIFDLGGVFHIIDNDGFFAEICAKYNLEKDEFAKEELALRIRMDLGYITFKELIGALNENFHINIDETYYRGTLLEKYVHWNQQILDFVIGQRGEHKIVLLTNNNEVFYEELQRRDMLKYFDRIVFSFQEKLKKPDPNFFSKAIKDIESEPSNCVFVDDRTDHVEAAIALGFNGIVYKDFSSFREEIQERFNI
jgi:HAD superfamily hydrolase (TIGR01509 family)